VNDYERSYNDLEQEPPNNREAEQAALGAMQLTRTAIADVIETVRDGADFYRPAHETIYNTIVGMYGRGQRVDPITLTDQLRQQGDLERAGGSPYLHVCVNAVPTAAHAQHYAEIIRDLAILRRVDEIAIRTRQAVREAKGDPAGIVDEAQAALAGVLGTNTTTDTHIAADVEEYFDRLEHFQREGRSLGVPTGFMDLDALFGGFLPGQVIIVAARPAMGKSTLAVDFLRAAAITYGLPSVLFSMEMGRDEIKHRLFSAQGRIPLHHIRQQAGMTDDDWARLAKVAPRVNAAPLHIDTDPNKSVARIQARCRALQQAGGLRLVVIDYLQLMQSGTTRRDGNRQQEIADITRSLKLTAMELQVPIVVLSQLNRGPEQRADKTPMVSDLRESGAIENDADIVILIHREDAYDKTSPRAGEADLIVGKNRNGSTPTVTVAFQGHYSRFVDMAET
jgi:replicative DNA helicase